MNKYQFNLVWSNRDNEYMVTCPEFPGLSAFGETAEEALAEAQIALELFIETYQEVGIVSRFKNMNSEYIKTRFNIAAQADLPATLNSVADEIDGTQLKIEINEIVWCNASQAITLKEAEEIATPFWSAIMETHNK